MRTLHPERHAVSRIGWLRAAVLGANDGIVSTGSLIVVAPLKIVKGTGSPTRVFALVPRS